MKKVPFFKQMGQYECGPACLTMLLNYHGCKVSLNKISEQCGAQRNGVSVTTIKSVSNSYGLNCRVYQVKADDIYSNIMNYLPCILFWDNKHFVVLEKIKKGTLEILDPNIGRLKLEREKFEQRYSGVILTFEKTEKFHSMIPVATNKFYFKYISKNWSCVSLILLFAVITQAVSLLVPFLIKYLVDDSLLSKSTNTLSFIGIAMISVISLLGIFMLIRSYFEIKFQATVSKHLSTDFMGHLLKLPLNFFENRTTGDIAMRVSNIAMIRDILARGGTSVILDIITLISFFIAMLTQSVRLALFAIGVAILQFILMAILIPKKKELIRGDLSSQTAAQSFLVEALRAIPFIKSNGLDQAVMKKWTYYNDKQIDMFTKRYHLDAILESISISIRFCAPLLLLWFGSIEVINGSISLGSLLGFGILGTSFLIPVASLITSVQKFQLVGDVFERIQDVMESEPEQFNQDRLNFELSKQDIKLKNVSFSYHNNRILNNICLDIKAGSKVALVGRTGSGKTTLSRIILGLYRVTEGKVLFGDKDLNDLNLSELRKQMGVVLQESFLFNDTIANNISGFKNISQKKIEEATKKVRLYDDIMRMPMGFNTIIGENGSMLSGGQRQRLAIARAIVHNPSIVILDEITSNLDALTEQYIDDYFAQTNITRIIITHRLLNSQDADLIVVLDQGNIIEKGTHQELLKQQGEYYNLWIKQVENKELVTN